MPLVNSDIKGLEVVVAAQLSGDKVLRQEIIDKVDFHEANRDKFRLGGNSFVEGESRDDYDERKKGRLVAKTLKFRTIYGGSAYSFANDPDMNHISKSQKFWQNILEEYFTKYAGLKEWHEQLILTAQRDGKLEIPSGRYFPIAPMVNKWNGGMDWPITVIKNYPVQGFGADLVMLARLEANKRLRASGLEYRMVSTIHDSIVVDCPSNCIVDIGRILNASIEAVPAICKQVFGYDFSLPLTAEIQSGPNKKDMKDLTFN